MGLASGGKGCFVLLCPLFTSKWTGKGGARRTIIIMKELAMDGLGMRGEGLISMTIGGEVWVKLLLFFLRGGR